MMILWRIINHEDVHGYHWCENSAYCNTLGTLSQIL